MSRGKNPDDGVWRQEGFSDFIQGTFGNAGQNLYVSRAGVLQRIHQFDLTGNGYLDLIFCNSQNHWERPPVYVYRDPLGSADLLELPAEGALGGTVSDLNGDGLDDLVIANGYNGIDLGGLNSTIYYGDVEEGWSQRRHQHLPTPEASAVAAGDFNGDGRPDLVFVCGSHIRLFYQNELAFEPKRFVDLDIEGVQIETFDLDGDGFADLLVRAKDGSIRIYWGSPSGISIDCVKVVASAAGEAGTPDPAAEGRSAAEWVPDAEPMVRVVRLPDPHLFVARPDHVLVVPILPGRRFGEPKRLSCHGAMSIAAGDVNGDGYLDLVLACRHPVSSGECSWVYWGNPDGHADARRTALPSFRACDVAVGDLDGNGCDDIVLCQNRTKVSCTTESLLYRGGADPAQAEPKRLVSHDARRVFITTPWGDRPCVAIVNHFARTACDNVKATIYGGGPDGFAPERRRDLIASGAIDAIACDLNDNGYLDLVLCNGSEYTRAADDPGCFVYFGGPDGLPNQPALKFPTIHGHGLVCADIDRDGFLELLITGFGNPDLLIFRSGAGGFDVENPIRIRLEHDGVVYQQPRWIQLADLNNDGWLDLFVPMIDSERSFVLWGGPEGFSMERVRVLSVYHAACARVVDLTGNGYLDLVVGGHAPSMQGPHDSFVYIYWNGPEGLREDRRTLLPAKAVNSMALADFNNDGRLDLYIGSYTTDRERDLDSYIYWNRAGRYFSADDRTALPTHSASGCMVADFNRDGWIDLAVANHKVHGDHVGYSQIWWNGPEGFDPHRTTRLPTSGPHGMRAIEPGNLVDRGPEEYYVSAPHQLPAAAAVRGIDWEATVPDRTWVRAQLRFADTAEDLATTSWRGPDGDDTWFEEPKQVLQSHQGGTWVQYRLALGAFDGVRTPRVTAVNVHFVCR